MSWDETGQAVELGAGVTATPLLRTDGTEVGFIIAHPNDETRCVGTVWLRGSRPEGPKWDMPSREPLTLTPSVRCHCGFHGWIRAGKWVAA